MNQFASHKTGNCREKRDGIHHVLWTGGWDSTFRVCQLTLLEGKRVQPHYLIDYARNSTALEQRLIKSFTDQIHERVGKILIAKPKTFRRQDLAPNETVSERIRGYMDKNGLGKQYDWLIRYVLMNNLQGLELCVHKDDRAYPWTAKDSYFMECFSYPILDITKLDMREIARKHGFLDILNQTWFCHAPVHGKPCGHCGPCRYAVKEGLGDRVPRMRQSPHFAHYIRVYRFYERVHNRLKRGFRNRASVTADQS